MNAKIITIITFLTLILSSINVYSIEDFAAVTQNYQIDACKCANTQTTLTIGNIGQIENTYMLYQTGNAAKFSILSETTPIIEGGKTKTILDILNIPCNTKTGNFELNTQITDGLGHKKLLKQIITIKECKTTTPTKTVIPVTNKTQPATTTKTDTIQLTTQTQNTICACEKTTQNIRIKSTTTQTLNLSIQGQEWAKIGINKPLETKENITYDVDLTLEPNCQTKGQKQLTIIATNQKGTSTKQQINIDVLSMQECNPITILTDQVTINKTNDKSFNIQIKNEATKQNNLDIQIIGPEWISTKTAKITLEQNQTKNLTLNLNTTNTTKDGTYQIKIEAKKANTTIYQKNIDLTLGQTNINIKQILIIALAILITGLAITIIAINLNKEEKNQEQEKQTENIRIEEIQETPKKKTRKNRKR